MISRINIEYSETPCVLGLLIHLLQPLMPHSSICLVENLYSFFVLLSVYIFFDQLAARIPPDLKGSMQSALLALHRTRSVELNSTKCRYASGTQLTMIPKPYNSGKSYATKRCVFCNRISYGRQRRQDSTERHEFHSLSRSIKCYYKAYKDQYQAEYCRAKLYRWTWTQEPSVSDKEIAKQFNWSVHCLRESESISERHLTFSYLLWSLKDMHLHVFTNFSFQIIIITVLKIISNLNKCQFVSLSLGCSANSWQQRQGCLQAQSIKCMGSKKPTPLGFNTKMYTNKKNSGSFVSQIMLCIPVLRVIQWQIDYDKQYYPLKLIDGGSSVIKLTPIKLYIRNYDPIRILQWLTRCSCC